jgi:hypothetical protein
MKANGIVRTGGRNRVPVRTCCGCGQREAQSALTRLVRTAGGGLVLDAERRHGGRGAYLHPRVSCWQGFVRGKGLVRSLRAPVARSEREAVVAALQGLLDRDEAARAGTRSRRPFRAAGGAAPGAAGGVAESAAPDAGRVAAARGASRGT